MARHRAGRRRGGGAAPAAAGRSDVKKEKKMSKEARQKLIKSLTTSLEQLAEKVKAFGAAPNELEFAELARTYSAYLVHPAPGHDDSAKSGSKDKKKTPERVHVHPDLDYIGLKDGKGVGDVPAVTVLSQIRDHLVKEEQAISAELNSDATLASRQRLLQLMAVDEKEKKKGKGKGSKDAAGTDDAEEENKDVATSLPPAVSLGINAIFAFLAEAAETHPELCLKPLKLLSDVIGAFQPQQLAHSDDGELLGGVAKMLTSFSRLDSGEGAAAGSLGALLSNAHSISMTATVALALAKGSLSDVLAAVKSLLDQLSISGNKASDKLLEVPSNLQLLAKMARGVSSSTTILPTTDTFASGWTVQEDSLRKAMAGGVPTTPSSVASDGSHLYMYMPASSSVIKVGTGYNETVAGNIVHTLPLSSVFGDVSATECDFAGLEVQLLNAGNNRMLLAVSPDPNSGFGTAIRLLSTDLKVMGVVTTPFHGNTLFEDVGQSFSALPDIITTATTPAPATGAATVPTTIQAVGAPAVKLFSTPDGSIFALLRPADADDISFGRHAPHRYDADLARQCVDAATAADTAAKSAAADADAESKPDSSAPAVPAPSPFAFGAPAFGAPAGGLFGAPAAPAVEKKKKEASTQLPKLEKKKVTFEGITYDPQRPAGSTLCQLRKLKLVDSSDERGGASTLAARLAIESTLPIYALAAAADCQLGLANKPEWDTTQPSEFPRWLPAIQVDDAPVLVASAASNSNTNVIVGTDGRIFYSGDGAVLGAGASVAGWNQYDGMAGLKVTKVAMAPRCRHALFLTEDGQVYAVGAAEDGQLGLDIKSDKQKEILMPKRVVGELADQIVVDISVAEGKSAAVTATGKLYTWGSDSGHGELGWSGAKKSLRRGGARKKTPTLVDFGVAEAPAAKVAAGGAGIAVFKGPLVGLGLDELARTFVRGERGEPKPLGDEHKFAFTLPSLEMSPEEARANAWFDEHPTALLDMIGEDHSAPPAVGDDEVAPAEEKAPVAEIHAEETKDDSLEAAAGVSFSKTGAVAVSLSATHMVVLTTGGAAWTVGDNKHGQCARAVGTQAEHDVAFSPVRKLPSRVVDVVVSDQQSLFLCADGSVWACGENTSGSLGVESGAELIDVPTAIKFPQTATRIINIHSSGLHSVAVDEAGHAYAWGRNKEAQLNGCEGVTKDDALAMLPKQQVELQAEGSPFSRAFCLGSNTLYIRRPSSLPSPAFRSASCFAAADTFALTLPCAPVESASVARMFRISNGTFIGDKPANFSNLLAEEIAGGAAGAGQHDEADDFEKPVATFNGSAAPAVCLDTINGLVWAVASIVSPSAGTTVAIGRYEAAPADKSTGSGDKLFGGRQVLADPRYAIPVGSSARVSAEKAAMAILGVLDEFSRRSSSAGAPDVSKELNSKPTASSKAVGGTALQRASMEELHRFKVEAFIQGWGMSGADCISFKANEDVYLCGLGMLGASDTYRGKIVVTPGFDSTKERLVEHTFEVERKSTGEITECLFDEPVLLAAHEQYHLAQEHITNHVTGWYCNGGGGYFGGGDYKVESESGVEFNFCQTRDFRNNGTSCDRGLMPVLYFKSASAVRASAVPASARPSEEASEQFPDVDYDKFCKELNPDGVSAMLAIMSWALQAIDAAVSHDVRTVATFALRICLRVLTNILQAPEASSNADIVPTLESVAKVLRGCDDPESEQSADVLRKSLLPDAELSANTSWLPTDAGSAATTLWELDSTLRRALALALPSSVMELAQNAYVLAFPFVQPTWKLKLARYAGACAAAVANKGLNGDQRVFEAVLSAIQREASLSTVFGISSNTNDGAGAAESKFDDENRKVQPLSSLPSPDGPLARRAMSIEPLLADLYAAEQIVGNGSDPESTDVRPLINLIKASTEARLRLPPSASSSLALAPFVHSAASLITMLQQQLADMIGKSTGALAEKQEVESLPASGNSTFGEPLSVSRFDSCAGVGWGYGGSPDAICFRVDTPIYIAGFGLYGGTPGEYEGVIKLMEGPGGLPGGGGYDEEGNPLGAGDELATADVRWEAADSTPQEVLFDEPVLIESDKQYCAYLLVRSALSSNSGSAGKAEVEADGVKFNFEYSSGSNNGTGVDGGQIPQILYHLKPKAVEKKAVEAAGEDATAIRDTSPERLLAAATRDSRVTRFLQLAKLVMESASTLLEQVLSGSLAMKPSQAAAVLTEDKLFTMILPQMMPHIARIFAGKSTAADTVYSAFKRLLTQLDSVNELIRQQSITENSQPPASSKPALVRNPSDDGNFSLDISSLETRASQALAKFDRQESSYCRTMVESDHPYLAADRKQWDITLPTDYNWMVVTFDPQCATTQFEDRLTFFTDATCKQQIGDAFYGQPIGVEIEDAEGDRKKKAALANKNWPTSAMIIPSNSFTVVFETASDYVNNANASKFGFRIMVTGHGLSGEMPLLSLEREMAHAAALLISNRIAACEVPGAAKLPTQASENSQVLRQASGVDSTEVKTWEWEPVAGTDCPVDGGSVTASSTNGSSGVILNYGISSGQLIWDMTLDEETTSQCTCFGVATREISTCAYQNPEAWMQRCFNGYSYKLGTELRDAGPKINRGDNLTMTLDMDAGTLSIALNDEPEKQLFDGILDKVGVGGEVAPCILFYSTGPSRRATLHGVRHIQPASKKQGASQQLLPSASSDSAAEWAQAALRSKLLGGGIADSDATSRVSCFLTDIAAAGKCSVELEATSGAGSTLPDPSAGQRLGAWLRRTDLHIRQKFAPSTAPSAESCIVDLDATQSEALHAAFASMLWHNGVVAEAIASGAYLRFHPELQNLSSVDSVVVDSASDAATVSNLIGEATSKAATGLPPVLGALLIAYANMSNVLRPVLLAAAPAPAESAETAAELPGINKYEKHDSMRKKMQDVSFRVRGGAEEARAPTAGVSVPRHIQKELDNLVKARAGLTLHLTPEMGWETKKAKNMNMPADDRYMAGPAKPVDRAAVPFAFGAPPASDECSYVFATPFEPERYAMHYFEIEILEKGKDNVICVGLVPEHETNYKGHLGWRNKTMGYHGDDGVVHCSGLPASETFTEGDTVGVGWVPALDYVFFTKNGRDLGIKYAPPFFAEPPVKSVTEDGVWKLRPAVTAREGAVFIANFGQAPFSFAEMEALRQAAIEESIKRGGKRVVKAAGQAAALPQASTDGALAFSLKNAASSAADVAIRANFLLQVLPHCDPILAVGMEESKECECAGEPNKLAVQLSKSYDAEHVVKSPSVKTAGSPPPLSRAVSLDSSRASTKEARPALLRHVTQLDAADGEEAASLIYRPSSQLSTLASSVSKLAQGSVKRTEVLAELFGFLGVGPTYFLRSAEAPDVPAPTTALDEVSHLRSVMNHRTRRAEARFAGVEQALQLLTQLKSPSALQELFWCIASVVKAQGEDFGAHDDGNIEEQHAEKWLLAQTAGESSLSADLVGSGPAALRVRQALHRLLEEVAAHLFDPASTQGVASTVISNARKAKAPYALSSARRMVQLLALRVWRLPLDSQDHPFLQNSVIFSRLRDLMKDDLVSSEFQARKGDHESAPTALTRVDITGCVAVEASTNVDRAVTLTDPTTETYWEPEGVAASKELMLTLKADQLKDCLVKMKERRHGKPDEQMYNYSETATYVVSEIAVFLDHTRDKERKTKTVELCDGGESHKFEIPDNFVGWAMLKCGDDKVLADAPLKFTLKFAGGSMPRVRGLRVLAYSEALRTSLSDGLKVDVAALSSFRSLASQVFAGLSADADSATQDELPESPELERQGSELRQRLAGMLFDTGSAAKAPGRLGGLQDRVLELIASELSTQRQKFEEAKWWTKPQAASSAAAGVELTVDPSMAGDAYCYELVSMLQSLSASSEGRSKVAEPALFSTCVALFPVATPRIQRSLIQIFKRVLPRMKPDALDVHLKVPRALLRDALRDRLAVVQSGSFTAEQMVHEDDCRKQAGPGAFLAYLMLIVAKSLNIQTKGRASGRAVTSQTGLSDDIFPGSVPASVMSSLLVVLRSLSATAAPGSESPMKNDVWKTGISALSEQILTSLPAQMETVMDAPAKCAFLPQLWVALALLAVAGEEHERYIHLDSVLPSAAVKQPTVDETPTVEACCDNHQDGKTLADVTCAACGPDFANGDAPAHFCRQCDSIIHLRKSVRDHTRNPIASRAKVVAESTAAIDCVAGCTRFKLQWLQMAVYEQRCKATIEFKKENHPSALLATAAIPDRCRFCQTDLTIDNRSRIPPASPALENVCNQKDCEDKAKRSCRKVKDCGHFCGGVCDEESCLPCFQGCDGVTIEADNLCETCMTENIGDAPSIRLDCGHVFHYECIETKLKLKWYGPRIEFGFMGCPLCRKRISHATLKHLLDPLLKLEEVVKKKALMRLSYENLAGAPEVSNPESQFYRDPTAYAMHRFAYYMCSKCSNPYYGGEARCGAAADVRFNPDELICTNCLPHSADAECPKHGRDFITYKCQFCCAEALFFCFGTTHFCDRCHSDPGRMQDLKTRGALPHCPAGPLGKQLPGGVSDCELKSKHPEPGTEHVLGCSICRNASTF